MEIPIFFSDVFNVSVNAVEQYGAFNISLVKDLPLFIDPFLLFNSDKDEYQTIHQSMINYLVFLRELSNRAIVSEPMLRELYTFPEIKQNWLGFSLSSNAGRGLGMKFAHSLSLGFTGPLSSFGKETISSGSHIEKLCIIHPGTGKDFISDFSTNMALGYLAQYTEGFTKQHLRKKDTKRIHLRRTSFNYQTGTWDAKHFILPWHNGDYVLLTPADILTKDDTWISQKDLYGNFDGMIDSFSNEVLREQINRYFDELLLRKKKELNKDEYDAAISHVLQKWPDIIDYYIKGKEEEGDRAVSAANQKVTSVNTLFVNNVRTLIQTHLVPNGFTRMPLDTYEEAKIRLLFLKATSNYPLPRRFLSPSRTG